MKPVPNRAPNRVQEARLKAERAALNDASGAFKTGAIKSSAEKRNTTRADRKRNAIREDLS